MRNSSQREPGIFLQTLLVCALFLAMSAAGSLIVAEPSYADAGAIAAQTEATDASSVSVVDIVPAGALEWIEMILAAVGLFAAIAAVTKTERDDKWVGYLVRLIDVLGLNIGHAKNENRRR